MKKTDIRIVIERLGNMYGRDIKCYLEYEYPWQLLVATILSAQCTDNRVNLVTRELFVKYKNPEALMNADISELEQDIRACGFHHNKSLNIRKCMAVIHTEYKDEVPSDIDELVKLPGVGRKTANVIRGNIYGIPSIVVDTHVKRVSKRLGLTKETDPVKIEYELMKKLDETDWIAYNKQIMALGRSVCKGQRPACADCFLKDVCDTAKQAVH